MRQQDEAGTGNSSQTSFENTKLQDKHRQVKTREGREGKVEKAGEGRERGQGRAGKVEKAEQGRAGKVEKAGEGGQGRAGQYGIQVSPSIPFP